MSFDLFGALSPSSDDPNRTLSDELETHKKTDGDQEIDLDNGHDNGGAEQPRPSGPRQVSQVEVEGSTFRPEPAARLIAPCRLLTPAEPQQWRPTITSSPIP